MQIAVAFYCSPLSRIFCHKCTCISAKFESLGIALVGLVRAKEGTASLVMSALSNYVADILRHSFWWFQSSSGSRTYADGVSESESPPTRSARLIWRFA